MDSYNIESYLAVILQKRAYVNFIEDIDLRNEKLLGQKICMPARELVLTLFDIERDYNVKIPEQAITNGSFDTFNHILKIVKESLGDENNNEGEINYARKENASEERG